jgi:hypothetical protein
MRQVLNYSQKNVKSVFVCVRGEEIEDLDFYIESSIK